VRLTPNFTQSNPTRSDLRLQRRLGYRRLVGRGVAQDAAAAFRAFQVAAEGGDAMALYNLGWVA
jgi:TPR repeat protein